jgi:hypothetical protein
LKIGRRAKAESCQCRHQLVIEAALCVAVLQLSVFADMK